jgi:PAS domain S-box-containing protein
MNSSDMVSFKNSIANQLLKVVFSVYLILTFTVTIIHMVTEYTHTRQKVIEELRTIESTFKPTLSRALWDMNFNQIRSAFLGIEKLPTVIGVQVEDNEGKLIGMAGKIIKSDGTSVLVDRMGRETVVEKAYGLFWHEFSVTHLRQNRTFQLGNVRLYSSASVVLDKVMLTFIFLIINAVIKIVALWLIFLYVFRLILGRPLSALTNATRQIHLDNLEDVSINIKTSKRNELKVLETAFNEMIDKLLSARSRLNDYMDEETERLEGLVEERTRELTVSEGRFRRSEAELRALFASMTDVILVLNREGLYLKIAPTSSELLYKPLNELINKTLHEVFPEHEAQLFLDAIHRSLNQNTTVIIEYALYIGGREVWFDGRISPISEDTIICCTRHYRA